MRNLSEETVDPVARRGRRSAGFTLIEMLVVVAILVILAGFILPKLDRAQLKSNKGVAAANLGGVSRYIQTYRILHNVYPDRWDSLLNAGATEASHTLVAPGAPGTTAGIDPQLTGGPPAGSPVKLTTTTLTEDATTHEVRSLLRMGITSLSDWGTAGLPGDRFTEVRGLANGSTVATINVADDDGKALIDHIYPENKLSTGVSGTIPAGKKLVVLGFGPTNAAIGDVLQECPTYANTDPTQYYNRNLAIFEIDDGGGRCELKAVVGGDADRIDEEINDFYER